MPWRLAEVLRRGWTVIVRRRDVAVVDDLVGFRVSGSHGANPRWSAPLTRRSALQRRRCAGSTSDQFAWLSAVLGTSPALQWCAARLRSRRPAAVEEFGEAGLWSTRNGGVGVVGLRSWVRLG